MPGRQKAESFPLLLSLSTLQRMRPNHEILQDSVLLEFS